MGEAIVIAVLVVIGIFWVRGAISTHGGSAEDWGNWAEGEARNLGSKARDAWRNRYDDEYPDEGED